MAKAVAVIFSLLWSMIKGLTGMITQIWARADYEKRLASNTLDSIQDGFVFEDYMAMLLRKNGYSHVEQTKKSGDQGVDIIARKDGRKYAVQCKLYGNPVGNKAVQEIVSGMIHYGCDAAVVATNSVFTQSARELSLSTGAILWDREVLVKMERNL